MLAIDNSTTVTVHAKPKWNDTGIRLAAGGEYRLVATGEWTDLRRQCDADGYRSSNLVLRWTERLRRAGKENWFALVGSLDPDSKDVFLIGKDRTLVAPTTGSLRCFANDVPFMYWNNSGSVELTVTRLR